MLSVTTWVTSVVIDRRSGIAKDVLDREVEGPSCGFAYDPKRSAESGKLSYRHHGRAASSFHYKCEARPGLEYSTAGLKLREPRRQNCTQFCMPKSNLTKIR